jgi:hypothetical protein
MKIPYNEPVFMGSRISMYFDISDIFWAQVFSLKSSSFVFVFAVHIKDKIRSPIAGGCSRGACVLDILRY